jgi:rare lipoprotein A
LLGAAVLLAAQGCAPSSRAVSRERGVRSSSLDRGSFGHGRFLQTGIASYYGADFHGKKTANGETFDKSALTAAHRTLPFDSRVRVTNLLNGKSVVVRINDRGPYAKGRIIDLSEEAGRRIGLDVSGTAKVKLQVVR